jgi:acid phosphatase (class A)
LTLLLAALALTGCLTPVHGPKYIDPDDFDFTSILPNPPANDSAQTRSELDEILAMQASRTPEQAVRVKAQSPPTPTLFAPIISPTFDFNPHPVTCMLLRQVEVDAGAVVDRAKHHWARPRPGNLDPKVRYEVNEPFFSTSYPSADTTIATAWAVVIQELFPEKRTELMAKAYDIGIDRILAGVHYRSDVVAGRQLGLAVAAKILKSADFQRDLAAARKELAVGKN